MKDGNFLTIMNNRAGDGAPFPITPELTAIAEEYVNREMIADFAMPYVNVGQMSFRYWQYPLKDSFANIETKVGRKGKPKVLEFTATEASDSCINNALDDDIPYDDISDSPENYDPVTKAAQKLTNLIITRREIEVAAIVQATGNYGTGYYKGCSAEEKFDNPESDPLDLMLASLDIPIIRPNRIFFGQTGWRYFRTHPKIVKAVQGNSGDSGAASKEQVAELLEVQNVYVGRALYDTTKKGQTESLSLAWGGNVAMLYIDETADNNGGITWGFTARKAHEGNNRWGGQKDDDSIGAKGGVKVRVGESRKEVVVAKKVGYLLTSVHA